jgi:hypothetical protein
VPVGGALHGIARRRAVPLISMRTILNHYLLL